MLFTNAVVSYQYCTAGQGLTQISTFLPSRVSGYDIWHRDAILRTLSIRQSAWNVAKNFLDQSVGGYTGLGGCFYMAVQLNHPL